jgi:hypothetical protein
MGHFEMPMEPMHYDEMVRSGAFEGDWHLDDGRMVRGLQLVCYGNAFPVFTRGAVGQHQQQPYVDPIAMMREMKDMFYPPPQAKMIREDSQPEDGEEMFRKHKEEYEKIMKEKEVVYSMADDTYIYELIKYKGDYDERRKHNRVKRSKQNEHQRNSSSRTEERESGHGEGGAKENVCEIA